MALPGVLLGPRTLLTERGGFATLFVNADTVPLKHGEAVKIASDLENSVSLREDGEEIVGFVIRGIEPGAEGWIVTSGIAEVALQLGVKARVGDVVLPGTEAGRVMTAKFGDPGVGHCIAVKPGLLDVLLHFI